MSQDQKESVQEIGQITSTIITQQECLNQQNKKSFDHELFKKYHDFYVSRLNAMNFNRSNDTGKFEIENYLAWLKLVIAKKGILFDGLTGRGKTFHLDIIKRFHGMPVSHCYTASGIAGYCSEYSERETRFLMHKCSYIDTPDEIRDICIDDIGAEPTLNIFGKKIEALELCIDELEIINKTTKVYLFATTNLSESMMEERYGSRFVSRLNALCSRVSIVGDDMRTI